VTRSSATQRRIASLRGYRKGIRDRRVGRLGVAHLRAAAAIGAARHDRPRTSSCGTRERLEGTTHVPVRGRPRPGGPPTRVSRQRKQNRSAARLHADAAQHSRSATVALLSASVVRLQQTITSLEFSDDCRLGTWRRRPVRHRAPRIREASTDRVVEDVVRRSRRGTRYIAQNIPLAGPIRTCVTTVQTSNDGGSPERPLSGSHGAGFVSSQSERTQRVASGAAATRSSSFTRLTRHVVPASRPRSVRGCPRSARKAAATTHLLSDGLAPAYTKSRLRTDTRSRRRGCRCVSSDPWLKLCWFSVLRVSVAPRMALAVAADGRGKKRTGGTSTSISARPRSEPSRLDVPPR